LVDPDDDDRPADDLGSGVGVGREDGENCGVGTPVAKPTGDGSARTSQLPSIVASRKVASDFGGAGVLVDQRPEVPDRITVPENPQARDDG